MREIEDVVKHDVIAFVSSVAETVGDEGRFLHLGLTSSDVVDSAFAMQLRDAGDLLLVTLDRLRAAVRSQAERHRTTPLCASSANTSPSSEATTASPPSLPTPLEMRLPTDTRHFGWPDAASSRVTVPAREAA